MKNKAIFIICLLLMMALSIYSQETKNDFPTLTGPYLGQKPPGVIPELFAPDIISTNRMEHTSPVFSPDGKYFFFNRRNAAKEKSNIYWVDAKIIEELIPRAIKQ